MDFAHGRTSRQASFSPREFARALGATFAYTPRVMAMVWQTSPGLTGGVAAVTVVRALIPAATIWLTKLVIDAVVEAIAAGGTGDSVNRVVVLVVLQLVLALAATALDHGGNALRAMLGDRFSNRINIMILEKAETLDLAYFEDSTFYDMLERARREANMRPTALVTNVFSLASGFIQLVSVAALLAVLAWWILLVVAVTSIPYLGADMWFARARYRMNWRRAPDARRLWYLGYVMTSDETVKEVRLFDLGGHLLEQYRRTFARFYRENRKLTLSRESVTFALGIVSAGTASGLYIFVALATIAGRLTLGDLTLYHQALVQTQERLRRMFADVNSMYEANLFLTNLFDFLAFEPTIRPDPVLGGTIRILLHTLRTIPELLWAMLLVSAIGLGPFPGTLALVLHNTGSMGKFFYETIESADPGVIEAMQATGANRFKVIMFGILPNVLPLLIVLFTLEMGIAVIVEAILSYVNLSLASDFPTWGSMIADGRTYVNQAPWLMILPIFCVIAVVLALNALGDGLKDALDPVMRR